MLLTLSDRCLYLCKAVRIFLSYTSTFNVKKKIKRVVVRRHTYMGNLKGMSADWHGIYHPYVIHSFSHYKIQRYLKYVDASG